MAVKLKTNDNVVFYVEEALASKLSFHNYRTPTIVKSESNAAIPLPNISSTTLEKVIKYCKRQVYGNSAMEDDYDYLNLQNRETVNDLLRAADSLGLKGLEDLLIDTVMSSMFAATSIFDCECASEEEDDDAGTSISDCDSASEEEAESEDQITEINDWVLQRN